MQSVIQKYVLSITRQAAILLRKFSGVDEENCKMNRACNDSLFIKLIK